jgi:hypothetical protein
MAKRRFRTFPPRKIRYNYHTSRAETKQKAHCIINETYYVSLVIYIMFPCVQCGRDTRDYFAFQGVHGSHFHAIFDFIFDFILFVYDQND